MKFFLASLLLIVVCESYGDQEVSSEIPSEKVWLGQMEKEFASWGEKDGAEKSSLVQKVRKMTARMIREEDRVGVSDEYADFLVLLEPVLAKIGKGEGRAAADELARVLSLNQWELPPLQSVRDLSKYSQAISEAVELNQLRGLAGKYDMVAIERAATYLMETYPDSAGVIRPALDRVKALQSELGNLPEWIEKAKKNDKPLLSELVELRRKILIEGNPEISNAKDWVAVRRYAADGSEAHRDEDRPTNWQGISSMPARGKFYAGEIVSQPLSVSLDGDETKLYKDDRWVGHLTPDFTGKKLMFTGNNFKRGNERHWDVFELDVATGETSVVTGNMPSDTDSYDSCYLPDGRILFVSTSGYHGVPCVTGSDYVGNLHLMDRKKNSVRRLTMDQDNNWFPTMLHNGRVMFLRWEYTESAHYFSRILMHMNPDGSDQKEYYGSNSYWPNSLFNAKEIPGEPGKFIGVVSGHHGMKRVGELVLFNVNKGRTEVSGAVQKIPGYGKPVENKMKDELVNQIEGPYFAEPFPLSGKFFLASADLKKDGRSMNIVLCDVFDNIVPLTASNYFIYADPYPVQGREKIPAIPDRVKEGTNKAVAYIADVYTGRAMEGVPRGQAKSIRVFTSEYSPRDTGGHYHQGMESNWDVKVLLGTAPVLEDGSAMFEVPADQPVTLQVLDGEGRALALMRSWFTAMPGEVLSCTGCHENQNEAPVSKMTLASRHKPDEITSWRGPVRTFSFMNEIQPVLDRNCTACHTKEQHDKIRIPDFESLEAVKGAPAPGSISYWSLHPYVRRNGPEGNYLGLMATEFFADTSELYQMLKKGHHGVELSKEDWDRLVTWIDMNVPYMGYWPGERNEANLKRRYELLKSYSTARRDYVTMDDSKFKRGKVEMPKRSKSLPGNPDLQVGGFPFVVGQEPEATTLDLGNGVSMKFRKIPAGSFVMGSTDETPQERPNHAVAIQRPCWMGETEVTLEQYRQFDPSFENGWYDMHYKDQTKPGYEMNNPKFPVIRVSWKKAMEFCEWLSKKSGKKVTLPTEAQWEFAARGGKDGAFYFGAKDVDFSSFANLGDVTLRELAVSGVDPQPIKNPNRFWDFVPRDEKWNDGVLHLAPVASYKPNPFHLYDMVGNVAEWTRSKDQAYPYKDDDGRNAVDGGGANRIVRGGSWRDRPKNATSSWRWSYPDWRPVHNVGFRVVIED